VGPVGDLQVRLGTNVAFLHPVTGHLLLHRVVCSRRGTLTLCGDNCREPDGTIRATDVLGVVACIERQGRRVTLGQGSERRLIAALSRLGVLRPTVAFVRAAASALTTLVSSRGDRNST
jgi:hypothetical protein